MKGMEHDPAICGNTWGCPPEPREPAQKRDHTLCQGHSSACLDSLRCPHFTRLLLVHAPLPGTHKSCSELLSPCHPTAARLPALLIPYNTSELVGKHET